METEEGNSTGLEAQTCGNGTANRQSLCSDNLRQAFKHVKSNKGAPGVGAETVEEFALQLEEKLNVIHVELKTDTYEPSPVKRWIEKEDGAKDR